MSCSSCCSLSDQGLAGKLESSVFEQDLENNSRIVPKNMAEGL